MPYGSVVKKHKQDEEAQLFYKLIHGMKASTAIDSYKERQVIREVTLLEIFVRNCLESLV